MKEKAAEAEAKYKESLDSHHAKIIELKAKDHRIWLRDNLLNSFLDHRCKGAVAMPKAVKEYSDEIEYEVSERESKMAKFASEDKRRLEEEKVGLELDCKALEKRIDELEEELEDWSMR